MSWCHVWHKHDFSQMIIHLRATEKSPCEWWKQLASGYHYIKTRLPMLSDDCNSSSPFHVWHDIIDLKNNRPVIISTVEGGNAEVGQVMVGTKFGSFLTPDMASKNDAMFGFKRLADFIPVINCTTLAFPPSVSAWKSPVNQHQQTRLHWRAQPQ